MQWLQAESGTLEWLGRFLGRIHVVGASAAYQARPTLDIQNFGTEPRDFIVAGDWLPVELRKAWLSVADQALEGVSQASQRVGKTQALHLQGDCHTGNVLWMLLSGETEDVRAQLKVLLHGYEMFNEFDDRELQLIEALRTLRVIHYSAWIARRWHDPAFTAAFPWFGSVRYWQDRILELREQSALMQEPPLGMWV